MTKCTKAELRRIVGFATNSSITGWEKKGLLVYSSKDAKGKSLVNLTKTAEVIKQSGRIAEADRIEQYLENPSNYKYPDPKTAKKTHNFRLGQKTKGEMLASEDQVQKIQQKIDDLNSNGIVCLDGVTLGANTQYHEALRIKEVALAAQRLVDYQKIKGDLIPKNEALSQMGGILLILKGQLRSLPISLAGRLLKCRTEGEVCNFLSCEIDNILKEANSQMKALCNE